MSSTTTKIKKTKSNKKHLKLEKTHKNNIIISDKNLGNKFTNFEESRLDESKTLLYEVNSNPTYFKKFSRGQIIKVRFGVNIGSEFSGEHFAIVISMRDSIKNPILYVIPLTSKKNKYNINIGNILYDEDKIFRLKKRLKEESNPKQLKQIKKCIDYYSKRKNKKSYACIQHLKTISKLSICKTMNDFDYLHELKVSSSILKELDKKIIKEFTNIKEN